MEQKIAYISLVMLALIGCTSVDSEAEYLSIAALRNIETNSRSILITESITLRGVVTANDEYGEFYNSLIIEDESDAVKIICECDNLYQSYSFGDIVEVKCSGLYLLNHYGALTLGAEPTGEYTLDYIQQSKLGQYVKEYESPTDTHVPLQMLLSDLTPLHTYRFVEIEDAVITNADGITTFCQRDPETGRTVDTYHTITDSQGNSAELLVDRLCRYADATLPTSAHSISAIVGYYNQEYSLTITHGMYGY